MAIYHLTAKIVSRGKGHSAVFGAAYQSRSQLADERTGERRDYARLGGLLFAGIYAPKDAPAWAHERALLWNHVEVFERRSDAQLARAFDVALMNELTPEQNRYAIQDWVRENFTRKGLIADVAIHAPDGGGDQRNIHAHVMVVMRKLDGSEFAAKKERAASVAERNAELEGLRESWERIGNRHLERHGHEARIDRRTLQAQGIEREPGQHIGPSATAIERRAPGTSELAETNREIEQRNGDRRELAGLETEARQIGAEIIDLAAERAMREARAAAQGRTDDTRPAFRAAAARATEPAAPIFDRDAADAAWMEQVTAAGIAKGDVPRAAPEARQQPEPEAERETRAGAAEPAHGAQTAASVAAVRSAPEPERTAPAAPEHEGRSVGSILGGLWDGLAKPFENAIAVLADFFSPPPPLTPEQAERAERAAAERHEEREATAAYDAAEEERFRQIMQQAAQQEQENFAARFGRPPGGAEREDDYDRGRERER